MKKANCALFRAILVCFLVSQAFAAGPHESKPASTGSLASSVITVGKNFEVSTADHNSPHDEVLIAAHPSDPQKLVACSMVDTMKMAERKMHTVSYTSDDGGATWKIGPTIPESGDPICDYDPDGAAYFGAIGDSPRLDPAIDWFLQIYRSADNGAHWEAKGKFLSGDRPWLAFDRTSGPHHGRMYVTYQARAAALDTLLSPAVSLDLVHSDDSGATFSYPRVYGVLSGHRLLHSLPTKLALLSDGTVVVSNWESLKKSAIADENEPAASWEGMPGAPTCEIAVVLVSNDGWEKPKVAKATDKYCSESSTTRTVDSLAVDTQSGLFKDRIYLAWTDLRTGHARIMFTYSKDRGVTWTNARAIDDARSDLAHHPNNFMPTLAVNKSGIVGVTWYDRRDSPDNIGYTTRFSASLDGGETWLPSVKVAEQPARFRLEDAPVTMTGFVSGNDADSHGPITLSVSGSPEFHGGDTAGLTADAAGTFHALWVDNRSGTNEVYTAAITVNATPAQHGSPDLSNLADLSGKVALDMADLSYDDHTQTVTVEASLRNKSKDPVEGKFLLRVLSLSSDVGLIQVTGADNSVKGSGAVFDFTGSVKGGILKPDESSSTKKFVFHLDDVHIPKPDTSQSQASVNAINKVLAPQFVNMDIQVLGDEPKKTVPMQ
ncbi:MAG TPA: sialidase family protein [Candidatus Koribacter sp.]